MQLILILELLINHYFGIIFWFSCLSKGVLEHMIYYGYSVTDKEVIDHP